MLISLTFTNAPINNDNSGLKKIRIVLEGSNADRKMIDAEKIVE